MYSGYGIEFDGKDEWNFRNDLAENIIIFDVYNSSLSHTDNRKSYFLILGEVDTFGINGSLMVHQKKV